MSDFSTRNWPEAFVSDASVSRTVSRAVKAGRLRKLASRLYTRNLEDDPAAIVRRNLWPTVAGFFPSALIADRTALENAPAPDGSVCLITEGGADIVLPGIILRPRRGPGPLPSDRPFIDTLFLASTARAYLENLRPSRARGGRLARTLPRKEIEERLETILRRSGAEALNRLRDEARQIALLLGLEAEADTLQQLAGSLLGTRQDRLVSPAGRARQAGNPYDPARLELFQSLHQALRQHLPADRPVPPRGPEQQAMLAFFEAYFSNFIEGTEFDVEEAAGIIFEGKIPAERPEDAHDVLGTWRLVSDAHEMGQAPAGSKEFSGILRRRHGAIMERRPDTRPGEFKLGRNWAGSTVFVEPELVPGTLDKAFELYRSLEHPFQRAVFMMFAVSEVHPFADGNGRVARIMMNAEFVAGRQERIIIPTVFRSNYLAALKALSQTGRAEPIVRTLDYAQRWTAAVPWGTLPETRCKLEACNAFLDPGIADREGIRLRLPEEAGS